MAQADKDIADASSIEAILKSLSSRPNVQCTLILSRKDGSVIRSSGFKETQAVAPTAHQDYKDNGTEPNNLSTAQSTSRDSSPEQVKVQASVSSPAERLAGSIFSFMKSADSLASAIDSTDGSMESFPPTRGSDTRKEAEGLDRDKGADTDVQLLRMRTRRQEVIIFPDTNYLCCVVQNTIRGGNTDGSR